jgi:hypothetical protein
MSRRACQARTTGNKREAQKSGNSHHQHVQAAGCLHTCGSQQKLSVHVPLGHAVDCLLVSAE